MDQKPLPRCRPTDLAGYLEALSRPVSAWDQLACRSTPSGTASATYSRNSTPYRRRLRPRRDRAAPRRHRVDAARPRSRRRSTTPRPCSSSTRSLADLTATYARTGDRGDCRRPQAAVPVHRRQRRLPLPLPCRRIRLARRGGPSLGAARCSCCDECGTARRVDRSDGRAQKRSCNANVDGDFRLQNHKAEASRPRPPAFSASSRAVRSSAAREANARGLGYRPLASASVIELRVTTDPRFKRRSTASVLARKRRAALEGVPRRRPSKARNRVWKSRVST